jgi:hypothetical protein
MMWCELEAARKPYILKLNGNAHGASQSQTFIGGSPKVNESTPQVSVAGSPGGISIQVTIDANFREVAMLRTVSVSLLATTALLGAVDSSSAWPRFADLPAADHNMIVPVQMRGGGMAAGGMGGGGMAGGAVAGGGMGGGGMAGGTAAAGGMAAKGTAAKGTAGAGAKGGMAGAGSKATAGAKGGMGGAGGGTVGQGSRGGAAGAAAKGGGAVNVNVHGTSVRPWVQRPYFGTVVGGIALGSVIAATAAPTPPADNLCWVWTSAEHTQGYWDYCTPPQ